MHRPFEIDEVHRESYSDAQWRSLLTDLHDLVVQLGEQSWNVRALAASSRPIGYATSTPGLNGERGRSARLDRDGGIVPDLGPPQSDRVGELAADLADGTFRTPEMRSEARMVRSAGMAYYALREARECASGSG